MKKNHLIYRLNFIFFLFVSFSSNTVLASDTSKIKKADYKILCSIYNDVLNKPDSLSSKEMILAEKVKVDLPELFNTLFVHIIKANSNIRYKLVKDFAEQQNNINWECDSARKYYADNFR